MHKGLRIGFLWLACLVLISGMAVAQEPSLTISVCLDAERDAARFTLAATEALPGTLYVRPAAVGDWPAGDLAAGETVVTVPFAADGLAIVEYVTESGDVYQAGGWRVDLSACAEVVTGDAPAIAIPVGGPGRYAIWFPDAFGTLTDSGAVVEAEIKDGAWVAVLVLGDRTLAGRAFEARRVD